MVSAPCWGQIQVHFTDQNGMAVEGLQVWLLTEREGGEEYGRRNHYTQQAPLYTNPEGMVELGAPLNEEASLRVVVVDPLVETIDKVFSAEQVKDDLTLQVRLRNQNGTLHLDLSQIPDTHELKSRWLKIPPEKWMVTLRMRNSEGNLMMVITRPSTTSLTLYGLEDGHYTIEMVVFTKYRSGSGFLYPANPSAAKVVIEEGQLTDGQQTLRLQGGLADKLVD